MVKIAVSGALGRMGQRIISLALKDTSLKVVFGLESSSHPDIGKKTMGIEVTADLSRLTEVDCLIDFSIPSASINNALAAKKYSKGIVIGTTGLSEQDIITLKAISQDIPVIFSPNMSIGVNLLFDLIKQAASMLGDYNVSLYEAHHIHKKDAPSGTAKKIVSILNEKGFSLKNEDVEVLREGEIVGDHKIIFESDSDTLEIFHSAKNRDIFVKGSLAAAKWLKGRIPGFYSMDDVLFKKEK